MKSKILVLSRYSNNNFNYLLWNFGDVVYDEELLWKDPESIQLVVFSGGADVSPALYGEKKEAKTIPDAKRDIRETVAFYKAKNLGIPMFGICRGFQFLNVMNGGKLVQHIDGHDKGNHNCFLDKLDGSSLVAYTNTFHHQAIVPTEDTKVLGWSYLNYTSNDKVIEAAYFPKIKAIGVQYHPECMLKKEEGFQYSIDLINEVMNRSRPKPQLTWDGYIVPRKIN